MMVAYLLVRRSLLWQEKTDGTEKTEKKTETST